MLMTDTAPKRPTQDSTAPDCLDELTALRIRLVELGYHPIPAHGKAPAIVGWNAQDWVAKELSDNPKRTARERIGNWRKLKDGTAITTGVRIEDGLLALDIDVNDAAMVAALLAILKTIAPDVWALAPMRGGQGTAKIALFCRLEGEAFIRIGSRKYRRPDDPPEVYHAVEIFGGAPLRNGNCSRQFTCYGPREYDKATGEVTSEYLWDGDANKPLLHDVALADLPTLSKLQGYDLLAAFEQYADAAGWEIITEESEGEGEGCDVYDLDREATRFEVMNHGGCSYEDLESLVDGEDLRCTANFIAGETSDSKDRCRVRWSPRFDCVMIKDGKTNARHYPSDMAPIPWEKTAEKIAAAMQDLAATIDSAQKATWPKGYFLEELQAQPVKPLAWIVEDFIVAGAVNGLFGDGGVGKDLVLLQLGIAMTGGAQWLGRPVKQGRVMYFPGEDDDAEVRRREDRITRYYKALGSYAPVRKQFKIIPWYGLAAVLAVSAPGTGMVKPTKAYEVLCEMIADFRPDLVIVGNRVNIFSVNQNDDAAACQCMGLLTELCRTYKTTVIMPSHVSLRGISTGEGTSGSVQWSNACRLRTYLRRVKDEDRHEPDSTLRELEAMKANWSATGKIVTVHWSEGVFKPNADMTALAEQMMAGIGGGESMDDADERELLRLFDDLVPGDHVSPNPTARNNVATRFFRDGHFGGLTAKTAKERIWAAFHRLHQKRVLTVVEEGPPSKRSYRIARPSAQPKN
jgi:hypothetical protein